MPVATKAHDEKEEEPVKNPEVIDPSQPKVLVVIPFAMVCSGKSHVWGVMQERLQDPKFLAKLDLSVERWTFKSVSSDDIRRQVMDELIAQKKLGKEKAFTQSRKQANKRYQDAVVGVLSDCAKLKSGEGCVVFLDKNHPADAVRYVVETVDTYIPDNVAHLKIYLAPEHSKLKPLPGFPYSQAFMAQVLTNAALRASHPTLDNSDPANAFAVCLLFLGLNRGTRFDSSFLSSNGLDDFMSLPIVAESPAR